jgi:hypothetical protein
LELPKKDSIDWQRYWFYVKEVTPAGEVRMPQYSVEPSVPRLLKVKFLPKG